MDQETHYWEEWQKAAMEDHRQTGFVSDPLLIARQRLMQFDQMTAVEVESLFFAALFEIDSTQAEFRIAARKQLDPFAERRR